MIGSLPSPAQGTIQSSGININFIQDLPRFPAPPYGLQRFNLDDWGRNTELKPLQDEVNSRKPLLGEKNVHHKITISDDRLGFVDLELHTGDDDKGQVKNYGLKGRATDVFDVIAKGSLRNSVTLRNMAWWPKSFGGSSSELVSPKY